jgi:hypothetical protein
VFASPIIVCPTAPLYFSGEAYIQRGAAMLMHDSGKADAQIAPQIPQFIPELAGTSNVRSGKDPRAVEFCSVFGFSRRGAGSPREHRPAA